MSEPSTRTGGIEGQPLAKQASDRSLERWATVVEMLDGRVNRSGAAVKVRCPLHEGGGHSLQVEAGREGYPMFHCFGECSDEWENQNSEWLKKLRKAIARLGVPEDCLRPGAGGKGSTGSVARRGQPTGGPAPAGLPTEGTVGKWHGRLCEDDALKPQRIYLGKQRCLNKHTILKAQIGKHYKRFTIPVRDADGALVNVRKYDPHADGKDKMIGVAGHNSPFIYPLWALDGSGDKPVLWAEGEFDSLLADQESNGQYVAITGTGGAGSPPKDLSRLKGRVVYIAFDCDEAGRKGARRLALRLVAAGSKAVYIVDLGHGDGEDLTDWFATHAKTAEDLWAVCEAAPEFDPEDTSGYQTEDVLWLNTVTTKPLRWMWKGRIPFGKLTMLEGDPGLGKSTLWVDWVARVTTGSAFPGCVGESALGKALIIAGEDDLEDTIVPRLVAAGADLERVATKPLQRDDNNRLIPLVLPDDLDSIERIIKQNGITFLVIDPVMAFLSEDINSHNDASTRKALSPLVEILQKTGAAGVLVRHLNKSGEMQALYRGGGSIAFIGTARSGLVVVKHPDEEGVVVLAQTKTNLSRDVKTLTYSIQKLSDDENTADTYIEWGEELDISADDLLGKKDGRTRSPERDEAVKILHSLLVDGPLPVAQIRAAVKDSGVSWRTFERAKEDAGVEVHQDRDDKGVIKGWLWSTGPAVTVIRGGG